MSPKHKRLLLASSSPRRRRLIAAFTPVFELSAPIDKESPPRDGETPESYVLRVSRAKAFEGAKDAGDAIVLGADTAVALEGEVLGKPATAIEARQMLEKLRGHTHRVVTVVTALDTAAGSSRQATKSSDVTMRQYSDREIEAYIESGEPFDKAGGYAVQDTGFRPAAGIVGCYLNIVGFPLCEVARLLDETGADVRLRAGWRPPAECIDCLLEAPRNGAACRALAPEASTL